MELRDAIAARRSIRKYSGAPVEREKLDALIEAARLCQSGHNSQPWRFMTLEGEAKDRVAGIMLNYAENCPPENQRYMSSSVSTAHVIEQASALILVFMVPGDADSRISDLVSLGAAIEHICLTATDLGLGALWIRQTRFTEKEIAERFGHPELEMLSAVAVGYAAESPDMRPRKSTDDITLVFDEK